MASGKRLRGNLHRKGQEEGSRGSSGGWGVFGAGGVRGGGYKGPGAIGKKPQCAHHQ